MTVGRFEHSKLSARISALCQIRMMTQNNLGTRAAVSKGCAKGMVAVAVDAA
jgi:hypothetical protein